MTYLFKGTQRHLLAYAVFSFVILLSFAAMAQDAQRFSRFVTPVDAVTLKTEGAEIKLWGIKPASSGETHFELRALKLMQDMIGNDQVNCRIMSRRGNIAMIKARCNTARDEDLAIALLQAGLVVRDRGALFGSVFASAYKEAEDSAQAASLGIWSLVNASDVNLVRSILRDQGKLFLLLGILVLLPIISMFIVGFMVRGSHKKLLDHQIAEANRRRQQEQALKKRERNLILSSIKGELEDNKSKIEAFLTVYMEMLSDIRNDERPPKYQQSGDVVARNPSFERGAYATHIKKLTELDVKMGSKVTELYSDLPAEVEYLDLTPNTTRTDAANIVNETVNSVSTLLPRITNMVDTINAFAGGAQKKEDA